MDLKNNKITVLELYKNPAVVAIFQREFGDLVNSPMIKRFSSMPLSTLLKIAKKHIEPERIEKILKELESL